MQTSRIGLRWRIAVVCWRVRWFAYERVIMRLYYAHDQGQYAIACDDEANLHYGNEPSRIWSTRCYVSGALKALLKYPLPDWFIDRWFVEVGVPAAAGQTELQPFARGTSDGASR